MRAISSSQVLNRGFSSTPIRRPSYGVSGISFPRKLFVCKANSVEFKADGSASFTTVPPTLLAAEKEEAKAVLTLFLRKQGLNNAASIRTINKADHFIAHLISKLHSIHKSRYLVGRELTTLEIRNSLIPYLESLLEEHGNILVDVVENFPNPPNKETPTTPATPTTTKMTTTMTTNAPELINTKKLRAIARMSNTGSKSNVPPHVPYLIDLGMNHEQIKDITRRFPAFAYYNLDRKIRPVVDFLLELGVLRKDIPTILIKRPQLCGISLSENLIPMMAYLEELGVDKKQWAKVIYRFPALLTYSRHKVKVTVDFCSELGLSSKSIGKVLTRCPHIISYSVDDKLRPTAAYFCSLGIDVGSLLKRCPQTFGLSIEANLKPITEFFLERGFTLGEVATMVSRYGALYTFSLVENLLPKWEFFQTLDYPNSELVKFPQFFGYSLEERVKPRYKIVKDCGVKLGLNQFLSCSEKEFNKLLEKKLRRMCEDGVECGEVSEVDSALFETGL
ncbi:hypothetical protein QJS10_CPA06g01375 [Acorus calamus]|uniref:Transcription termination factor MTERF5, chloroplastic n=1 Tax=Acorus calamus TaxID=4465 RepID=A0AAV9EQ04_ACOCL|nr:hypothetical protein QJS10_CPA06g01375 [Acorus calamus]